MRVSLAAVAGAILAVLSASALAQDRSSCLDTKDNARAIKGCSEIIRSDPKDAIAYYMRGNALAKNGDVGQAIADLNKAIALNPGFAPAYDSRANLYVAKGDYSQAVVDVTKAGELSAKTAKPAKPMAATQPDKPTMVPNAKLPKLRDKEGGSVFNPFRDNSPGG